MLHASRTWSVLDAPNLPDLAYSLWSRSYTSCAGFRTPAGLLVLNDSTGPDGAQEYAICRPNGTQVESLTVSWYEHPGDLLEDLTDLERGAVGPWPMGGVALHQIQTHAQHVEHGRPPCCA